MPVERGGRLFPSVSILEIIGGRGCAKRTFFKMLGNGEDVVTFKYKK